MPHTRFRASALSKGVLLPLDAGRIRSGAWLYASCRPVALAAQILGGALSAVHPSLVPGRTTTWSSPNEELLDVVASAVVAAGGDMRSYAVLLPSDRRRTRFSLLALDAHGHHSAFVKVVNEPLDPQRIEVLESVGSRERSFWAPRHLGSGSLGTWSYLVTTPMPPGPHVPARLDRIERRLLAQEVSDALPSHHESAWQPIHGDFGPWNVRRLIGGQLAVLDWEDATIGPSGADELWHLMTSELVSDRTPGATARLIVDELADRASSAALFWVNRLARPEPDEVDTSVARSERVVAFEQAIQVTLKTIIDQTAGTAG